MSDQYSSPWSSPRLQEISLRRRTVGASPSSRPTVSPTTPSPVIGNRARISPATSSCSTDSLGTRPPVTPGPVRRSPGTVSPAIRSPVRSAGYPQSGYGRPGYPAAGYPVAPLRADYAPWGKRVGAMLIDQLPTYVGLIIFYVGYGLWLADLTRNGGPPDFSAGGTPMIIGTVIMLAAMGWTIYNRWITAGRTGQSLGKRVTKITLISEETGRPIGALNAFLRDLVHILDGFAYIGYLWPLWDEKKQTFSDKLMKTIVVHAAQPPL